MKKLFLIVVASFALVMAHDFNTTYADDGDGIPASKLTGKYANTSQGSVTICFKPDFTATESCSTASAVAVPGNTVGVGQGTSDKASNCATATTTFSFPEIPLPPPALYKSPCSNSSVMTLQPGAAMTVSPTTQEENA